MLTQDRMVQKILSCQYFVFCQCSVRRKEVLSTRIVLCLRHPVLSVNYFLFFRISLLIETEHQFFSGDIFHMWLFNSLLAWVATFHCSNVGHCVQYFCAPKQWYNCLCLGFLLCIQVWMRAVAHCGEGGVYLHWLWKKNPLLHWGVSLHQQHAGLDAQPTELHSWPCVNYQSFVLCIISAGELCFPV